MADSGLYLWFPTGPQYAGVVVGYPSVLEGMEFEDLVDYALEQIGGRGNLWRRPIKCSPMPDGRLYYSSDVRAMTAPAVNYGDDNRDNENFVSPVVVSTPDLYVPPRRMLSGATLRPPMPVRTTARVNNARLGGGLIERTGEKESHEDAANVAKIVAAALGNVNNLMNPVHLTGLFQMAHNQVTASASLGRPGKDAHLGQMVAGFLYSGPPVQVAETGANGVSYFLSPHELLSVLTAQSANAPSLSLHALLGVAGATTSIINSSKWDKIMHDVAGKPADEFYKKLYENTGEPFRSVIACLAMTISKSSMSSILMGPYADLLCPTVDLFGQEDAARWYETELNGGTLHF